MSTPNNLQPSSPPPPSNVPVGDDQSTAALVCGILGLLVCGILGVAALVMGNRARKEARESGRPLSTTMNVAWILGIIGTIFFVLQLIAVVIVLVAVAIPNFSNTSDMAAEAAADANVRTGSAEAAAYAAENGNLTGFRSSNSNIEVINNGPTVIIRSKMQDTCRQVTINAKSANTASMSSSGQIVDCP